MSTEHDRGVSSTHCCYEMGYESGGQAGAAGLAGADLCHTRTNMLNWRCGYRSAVVRVEWYQRRTRDVKTRIRTTWARSGGRGRGTRAGQSFASLGYDCPRKSVSCWRRREGNREDEMHTNVCCIWAQRGWIRAGKGSGEHGREGRGLRDEKRRVRMAPPYVSTHLQSSARLSKPRLPVGRVDWCSIFPASQATTTVPAHRGHVFMRAKAIEKGRKRFLECIAPKRIST